MRRKCGGRLGRVAGIAVWLFLATSRLAQGQTPTTLDPASTSARQMVDICLFSSFPIPVGSLYSSQVYLRSPFVRFRTRKSDPLIEPVKIYCSAQIELAWTVVSVSIVVVLFLTAARIIFASQDAPKPDTAIGHEFWWEFRYPKYGVVTANERHIPVSRDTTPEPTFLKLTSADVNHSFWVPQLAGKMDLIANHINTMWNGRRACQHENVRADRRA
jgi:cytochrome c oxidase subunit 2